MNTLGPIPERSNARYTGYLTDETGAAIAVAAISALTLTVKDALTKIVVNSRNAQNVLNANGVTVHATSGLVTWTLSVADTTPINRNQPFAEHIAEFACTWDSTDGMVHPVKIVIELAPY